MHLILMAAGAAAYLAARGGWGLATWAHRSTTRRGTRGPAGLSGEQER